MKARVYARAGIPEYWIVNVPARCVEVHRDPDPAAGRYRTAPTFAAGDTLTAAAVPGLSTNVASLFG